MSKALSLTSALQCALDTAADQPREVPEMPAGWVGRATTALANDDAAQMEVLAKEIASAHSQYPAEFDRKGWLYDLREVLLANKLALRNAAGAANKTV